MVMCQGGEPDSGEFQFSSIYNFRMYVALSVWVVDGMCVIAAN